MSTVHDRALVWFRRDLRSEDQVALASALREARCVFCVFVFDRDILDTLEDRAQRRVEFIHASLHALHAALAADGGALIVLHARARAVIPMLARELGVAAVYANRDYEPAAIARDADVERALVAQGIAWRSCKDQVIFEPYEVLTRDSRIFSVFTPYKNAWLAKFAAGDAAAHAVQAKGRLASLDHRADAVRRAERQLAERGELAHVGAEHDAAGSRRIDGHAAPASHIPALQALGFERSNLRELKMPVGIDGARMLWDDFRGRLRHYRERRDFPAVKGPSYLSAHLRFGTISIRELVREASAHDDAGARTWLSELIWREFYFMILYHHPQVVTHAFRPEFDGIRFPGGHDRFAAWCEGRTGYPLVDAGMRQLNGTGYMHNRLRMISASFLVKDLHVDWRWGERYFARKLNDYDLSANNGGWQWAASTGCDAQPYFRIFNPVTQSERFDAHGKFIRMYLPELAKVPAAHIHAPWRMTPSEQAAAGVTIGKDYPAPLVDHAQSRAITLELFGKQRVR